MKKSSAWRRAGTAGDPRLGQFATPPLLARLIISRFRKVSGNGNGKVIDLGCGPGALASAFLEQHSETSATLVDIDSIGAKFAQLDARCNFVQRSVLKKNFADRMRKEYGEFSYAISNPPFISFSGPSLSYIEDHFGNIQAKSYRAELAFAIQAISCLSSQGQAAIFMPLKALKYGKDNAVLKVFLNSFGLHEVLRLPAKAFRSAEVEAAAFIFDKARPRRKARYYTVEEGLTVTYNGWFDAADLSSLLCSSKSGADENAVTLTALGTSARRGRHSANELEKISESFFHTTSFRKHSSQEVCFPSGMFKNDASLVMAEPGDILIPRVGRCLDNAAIVVEGVRPITDCVFKIASPDHLRSRLWQFISSEKGIMWRRSLAGGSCAKFIPKRALMCATLPVDIALSNY
ncbi:N-6 DNA methylase [Noviherbaspirillum pedocola]|uniref:N-6 DNA methylase n=1 Tax=Noviherbaspirillum pedocola TaxID=2801341 RepID=A0A934SYK9_9BURK|nr:N-6 DNA methylase [Noviherbaspirillum pedocola]MBK4738930.1 N-6 DNA methylase [Noviherbaspirillum pedocola]